MRRRSASSSATSITSTRAERLSRFAEAARSSAYGVPLAFPTATTVYLTVWDARRDGLRRPRTTLQPPHDAGGDGRGVRELCDRLALRLRVHAHVLPRGPRGRGRRGAG